jgi:hypothetical protein
LLSVRNHFWLDAGESPDTAESFKQKITLQSITFDVDGEFTFWFKDGGLFSGHSVTVTGNLTNGPVKAEMVG